MHNYVLAVLFALASALTIAWGTVVRHRIVESAPQGSSAILVAMRRPLWWAGMSTAIIAYVLQVVALGFGPLLIVQPVLVMSLMFTLPLSAMYEGRRISRQETFWSAMLTLSVTALVLIGRPVGGEDHPPLERWIPALAVGIVVLTAMDRIARRQIRRERALLQGLVTGAVFGYVAVLSKAVADVFVASGIPGLLTAWELYALILAASLGTWVQQNAFTAGALRTSLPAMKIGEPIVAFALGYLVLFERFRVEGWEWGWMVVAFGMMIVSTVVLSRLSI